MPLNLVLNGYQIIASESDLYGGGIVILGARYVEPGKWDYVTARMNNLDEREWYWGAYSGSDFPANSIEEAVKNFRSRLSG